MAAQGPLAGVRVLEIAGIGPGPFCAMVLADLGADVLRLERPGSSSRDRRYDLLVRNRPAIELDLKVPEGAAAVLRLVDRPMLCSRGSGPGWWSASASVPPSAWPATARWSTAA
jgi:alpha-methylacyl-CoA racemase